MPCARALISLIEVNKFRRVLCVTTLLMTHFGRYCTGMEKFSQRFFVRFRRFGEAIEPFWSTSVSSEQHCRTYQAPIFLSLSL